jgi:uncharacterized protein (DUF342 family)
MPDENLDPYRKDEKKDYSSLDQYLDVKILEKLASFQFEQTMMKERIEELERLIVPLMDEILDAKRGVTHHAS